ncbi:MAG: hypothetical protein ACREC6_09130 [Hyphomicrobiaceae bacterium]
MAAQGLYQRSELPALCYGVVGKKIEAVRYDRTGGWQPVRFTDLRDVLDLPALGGSIPLRDLYRWTPPVP